MKLLCREEKLHLRLWRLLLLHLNWFMVRESNLYPGEVCVLENAWSNEMVCRLLTCLGTV
jgi:hypothetical protein